jgi:hypothetical protein
MRYCNRHDTRGVQRAQALREVCGPEVAVKKRFAVKGPGEYHEGDGAGWAVKAGGDGAVWGGSIGRLPESHRDILYVR